MSAALDPELATIVAAMRAHGAPPPFSGTPAEARERMRRAVMAARERTTLPVVASTEDRVAEHQGLRVPVRVYRPVSAEATLPTVVFLHGGGFVLGSVELMDDIARKLCRDVEAVVVSVDYRLAPEHPFPAAHDDALAATRWALDHAETLGGDPARVALAGESAGANLAACAALALRGHARPLAAQLLVVPGLDMARDVTAIEARGIYYPMLAPADLREIARLSMGTLAHRAAEVPPSPLRAANVADLPPTLIAVSGHDPLREEGLAYAHRLEAAGVPTRLLAFDDMFHPFFGFFAHSAAASRAHDAICQALSDWLRRRD